MPITCQNILIYFILLEIRAISHILRILHCYYYKTKEILIASQIITQQFLFFKNDLQNKIILVSGKVQKSTAQIWQKMSTFLKL